MHSIIIKLFLVFGLSTSFISAPKTLDHNPCNIMFPRFGNNDWGQGIYLLPNNSKLNVYKNKQGEKFGNLSKTNHHFKFINQLQRTISLNFGDIEYIGDYSMSFLKIRAVSNDDYVQIFWNTYPAGLFVKKSELTAEKAKFFTYRKLLYNQNVTIDIEEFRHWASLGVNLNNSCLNLRTGPSINKDIIRCISSNQVYEKQFSHFSILNTQKDWAKVEVTTYKQMVDAQSECDYQELNKEIGWIKAMDNSGFPNIWYSVIQD